MGGRGPGLAGWLLIKQAASLEVGSHLHRHDQDHLFRGRRLRLQRLLLEKLQAVEGCGIC